jgi:hypothetical protein
MPQPHFATAFHVDVSTDKCNVDDRGNYPGPCFGDGALSAHRSGHAEQLEPARDQMAISEVGADASPQRPREPCPEHASSGPDYRRHTGADDRNPATWSEAAGRYRWIQQIDLQQPQSISVIALLAAK